MPIIRDVGLPSCESASLRATGVIVMATGTAEPRGIVRSYALGESILEVAPFATRRYGIGVPAEKKITIVAASDKDPVAVAFGERVRRERKAQGMTIETLAEEADLKSRYLWRVEDGRQNVTLKTVCRIAAALDMSLSELFQGLPDYRSFILPPDDEANSAGE